MGATNIVNPTLKETVQKNTELKNWLVNYVGNKLSPQDGNITVEMIVEVVAKEFPEFLLAVAEENFIRGYEQAIADIESEQEAGHKYNKRRKK
jgi:hypothetical protein